MLQDPAQGLDSEADEAAVASPGIAGRPARGQTKLPKARPGLSRVGRSIFESTIRSNLEDGAKESGEAGLEHTLEFGLPGRRVREFDDQVERGPGFVRVRDIRQDEHQIAELRVLC